MFPALGVPSNQAFHSRLGVFRKTLCFAVIVLSRSLVPLQGLGRLDSEQNGPSENLARRVWSRKIHHHLSFWHGNDASLPPNSTHMCSGVPRIVVPNVGGLPLPPVNYERTAYR